MYSKTSEPTKATGSTSGFSGSNASRTLSAVPVLQKVAPDEELQMKSAVVQKAAPEEEEPLQGKFATTQRQGLDEEAPLQGKFTVQREAEPEEEEPLQRKPNNTGLPDNLKSGIENLSGYSMDDVKVHYNSSKPAQLQALAYAQGTDIHVAPGQEQHLPHEAWHVVQQKQGRVQPTLQMKEGVAVNDDKRLESEADVMGGEAVQMKSVDEHGGDDCRSKPYQLTKLLEEKNNNHQGLQLNTLTKDTIPSSFKNKFVQQHKLGYLARSLSVKTNIAPVQRLAVIQRITLDEQPLHNNIPFNNNNQQAILNHMAGEWQNNNGGAVTGGHLLSAMEHVWGDAVPNSNPQAQGAQQANPADGVHFLGAIPRVRRVIGDQFTFKLVTTINAHKRVSGAKDSTFWPNEWDNQSLINTLQHSWQVGPNADRFASKQNTGNSFWYQWQTINGATAFPNGTIGTVTNTDRQRMRAGRAKALAYANREE